VRGLAASYVAVFHFYNALIGDAKARPLPAPIHQLAAHGWLGVEAFFVISGFVIAYSIRGAQITPGFLGRFAARRSIRLDPTYWLVIFVSFALAAVAHKAPPLTHVLANMVYLDNIVGARSLVGVGWTLCLEIQFYLLLVILAGIGQRLGRLWLAPFALLAAFSILVAGGWLPAVHQGLCFPFFYLFFAGALTWWALEGRVPIWAPLGYAAILVALWIVKADSRPAVAAGVSVAIVLVGRANKLGSLLDGRVLQYLGRISYSLYLVHPLVGSRLIRFMAAHGWVTRLGPGLTFVLAAVASLVASDLLHRTVERPTQRLARRISPTSRAKRS
jgi:peptidoglycan/LPS O-acetylase OafA/YrhL